MTSEGTIIRDPAHLAAIEAALDTEADDGMPLNNFYAVYSSEACRPARSDSRFEEPRPDRGRASEPARESRLCPTITGPVLFDASAAGSVLAQVLEPSLSGARPPLSMTQDFDAVHGTLGRSQRMDGPRGNARVARQRHAGGRSHRGGFSRSAAAGQPTTWTMKA